MKVTETKIPGVMSIQPKSFSDSRGFFMETWHQVKYGNAKLPTHYLQDNISQSVKNVLRGLHHQCPNPQGKLVFVVEGEIFDVAVDIRLGSPTFGKWIGMILSSENKIQLFIPEGLAHGFCVLSQRATVLYKCTDYYNPSSELTLLWNDPELAIDWPVKFPLVSEKDQKGMTLKEIPRDRLLRF